MFLQCAFPDKLVGLHANLQLTLTAEGFDFHNLFLHYCNYYINIQKENSISVNMYKFLELDFYFSVIRLNFVTFFLNH